MFIIIALGLVGAMLIYLIVRGDQNPFGLFDGDEEPATFVRTCVRDTARETIATMLPQGGFVTPSNYILYGGAQIEYICSTPNFYDTCTMQHPSFTTVLQEELRAEITDEISACYTSLEENLRDEGFSVSAEGEDILVTVLPGTVRVEVQRSITYTGESTQTVPHVTTSFQTPLYEFGMLASTIANAEAANCDFDYILYMQNYPQWDLRKWTTSDGSKIYTMHDLESDTTMNIATRGCVLPAGL